MLDERQLCARASELGNLVRGGDVILLEGPMGAGKTTFTRALGQGMGVHHPERVRSPTFALCSIHDGPITLWHVDLFRLAGEGPEHRSANAAFEALGLESGALLGSDHVLVVEWSDVWEHVPEGYLRIRIDRVPEHANARVLTIKATGARAGALLHTWTRADGFQ